MPKTPKKRNHRAEYARRIAAAEAKGLSRSAGRGHARAGERPRPVGVRLIDAKRPEERAIKFMKRGETLAHAAALEGVTVQHLRRYLKEETAACWSAGEWHITDDRPRQVPFYSQGKLVTPWLAPAEASRAAMFDQAVRIFLPTGDEEHLASFVGESVTDIKGVRWRFETDPNTLYELDNAGELDFPEIYKIVGGAQ